MPRDGEMQDQGPNQDQDKSALHSKFVFSTLLSEVYLLMDFVSGRAEKSLGGLAGIWIPGRPADAKESTKDEVIAHICVLRYPPPAYDPISAENAAFLLVVKDRLNNLTSPAIGLTIAFTTMAVGVEDPHADRKDPASQLASRFALARNAYPGLVSAARKQRGFNAAGLIFVLLLTLLTAYTSGVVAFGQRALDDIAAAAALHSRIGDQIRLAEAGLKADTVTTPGNGAEAQAVFYRLCDRPAALRWKLASGSPPADLPRHPAGATGTAPALDAFNNATETALCDQARDADRKTEIVYRNLYRFQDRNLYAYEAPLIWATYIRRGIAGLLPGASAAAATDTTENGHDGDQWVALVLSSLGGYVLPMCFTLLGSALSIGRDIYGKMRTSTLDPRDRPLSYVRLALGLAAGAAIGLFISPGAAGATASGQAITLSASGLAFLAGYGVDSVFALFDSLLKRLTEVAKPTTPAPTAPG